MFDCGLVSVSFRKLEPNEIIELCKANDLRLIEWGSDVHAPCDNEARIEEIVALQKENDMICSSYGTYFRLGVHNTEELHKYIKTAQKLGTSILRLWCGEKNYEDLSSEERDFIISESKKAAGIAKDAGVTLCMECHNKTYTNCLAGALELMEAVDSPAFRMYWQPNQYRSLEENLEYAKRIAKYTKVIHVFNWEGKNKYPLAEAIEIWKNYLFCFDGSQTLLLEFMPDGKPETLGSEAEALRRIIT